MRTMRELILPKEEKIITILEEWYRVFISFVLIISFFIWPQNLDTKYFVGAALIYILWTGVIHVGLKRQINYSTDNSRIFRTFVDIIFSLFLIWATYGVTSTAFVLLVITAFFTSYRYPTKWAYIFIVFIIVSYTSTCWFANMFFSINKKSSELIFQIFSRSSVIALIFFSNRYSRLFLMQRLDNLKKIPETELEKTSLSTIGKTVCQTLSAQASLFFIKKDNLFEMSEFSRHDLINTSFSEKINTVFALSQSFIDNFKKDPNQFRNLKNNSKIFNQPTKDVAKAIFGVNTEIISIIAHFFTNPLDQQECAILVLNKLKLKKYYFKKNYKSFSIQNFRSEDLFLLESIMNKIKSEILLKLLQLEKKTLDAIIQEGIADEICTFNKDFEITLINKVKQKFFKVDDSVIGKKCYTVYARESEPCKFCKSVDAFNTDDTVEWSSKYRHPITRRHFQAYIKARRILNKNNEYEVLETVLDITEEKKIEAIRDFLLELQKETSHDERELAKKITNLFGELGFERIRLYEYEPAKQRLVCLASYGHNNDLGYRSFVVNLGKKDMDEEYEKITCEWIEKKEFLPILIRLKNKASETEDDNELEKYCTIRQTEKFPFEKELKKEKVTEQLDIPLVFGGKVLGKISVDNYSEEDDKEMFNFNKQDLKNASVFSRIVGYILVSSRKEQLDHYIEALSHEISGPLHIICGNAFYVRQALGFINFDKSDLQDRLTDILEYIELMDAIISEPIIERIKSEDYDLECIDLYNDVISKVLSNIRDYFAIKKEIDIKLEQSCELSTMKLDKNKWKLVFIHLLLNAVKYADSNTTVLVKTKEKEDSFLIDVENQGLEIPEYAVDKIFWKGYREPSGADMDPGGSGLGLFLSKLIVENHGCKLYVSNRNNPTRFTIELPKSLICKGESNA